VAQSLIFVAILIPLLGVGTPASARLVGDEFTISGNIPYQTWAGGAAYELSGTIVVGVAVQEAVEGPLQPCIGWYKDEAWGHFQKMAVVTADSTPPDVACAGNYMCLATWTVDGNVYARVLAKPGTGLNGDLWTVDSSGKAVSSVVAGDRGDYVVAWYTDDGKIGFRYVSVHSGPGVAYYVLKPAGCSKMAYPRLVYDEDEGDYGVVTIAFACPNEASVHVQSWEQGYSYQSTRKWTFTPHLVGGEGFVPDVAADLFGNFLLVWQSSMWSSARLYGARIALNGSGLGGTFAISGASEEQASASVAYHPRLQEYLVAFQQGGDIYYARIKGADGSAVGTPYAVTTSWGTQLAPEVAFLSWYETVGQGFPDESFLVMWTDQGLGSGREIAKGRWVTLEKMLGGNDPFSNEVEPGDKDHFQAPAQKGQWQAVGLRPGAGSDFDIYLYDGPDYTHVLTSSLNFDDQVDLVVMDGRQSDQTAYFPMAAQYAGDNYAIEYAPRSGQITQDNSGADGSVDSQTVVRVFDVYGVAGQPITLQVAPSGVDVGAAVFEPGAGAHQSLSAAAASADNGGAGQAETIVYTPDQNGWIGLVVWKNDDNPGGIAISSSGAGRPPNLIYLPLVGRNF
jgi:hypothetical protein